MELIVSQFNFLRAVITASRLPHHVRHLRPRHRCGSGETGMADDHRFTLSVTGGLVEHRGVIAGLGDQSIEVARVDPDLYLRGEVIYPTMDSIFIHIPKCGGTSLSSAIFGCNWTPKPNWNYRHLSLGQDFHSNSGSIWPLENRKSLRNAKIFTIIRDPLERLFSEYHFLKDNDTFKALLPVEVGSFEEFIAVNSNSIIRFLLGHRIFSQHPITEAHCATVLEGMEDLGIVVGLFDDYQRSLELIHDTCGVDIPPQVPKKRVTINRQNAESIPPHVRQLFEERNALDRKLYVYCEQRYQQYQLDTTTPPRYLCPGGEYEHIPVYTYRFSLIQPFLTEKSDFASRYFPTLCEIHRTALEKDFVWFDAGGPKFKVAADGKRYAIAWALLFLQRRHLFPQFDFENIKVDFDHPLSTILHIGGIVNPTVEALLITSA